MLRTCEEHKARVIVFLPVMIEIEKMGYNPVQIMFGGRDQLTTKITEVIYRALTLCKTKYPKWYAATSKALKL